MKVDKNEQGFLDVGDYVELASVTELDRYAYGQGLGKVILDGGGRGSWCPRYRRL